ncbi:GAP family protein [Pseudonocardia broussonetiae]|uniref:Sap-like sulfolipid-1-addressing protein n=1 Tax=Pseudonocardia broussonetiae TaxID=2736640 RepID=A0A6M6JX75_9PSEU|nr:GAP family protein [Pseudonocardia broussonetiae]QJY51159.1 hypothetical protein HOP40_34830 [Pseudonocardia broussonetiae]
MAGLAFLDAFNPATIVAVTLILLLPGTRPVATACLFVIGAYLTVLALGGVVYLAADAAADLVAGGLVWLRRIAFGIAAVVLLWSAARRLRSYRRQAIALPGWLSGWTALPLGIVVTGADLPNAFPYFIAIERLVSAGVPTGAGMLILAGYAVVYCLPCLLLIGAWLAWGERVHRRLDRLYHRFGTAREVPRSLSAAAGLAALSLTVASVAITA